MTKYQLISDPNVIVEAEQFYPPRHPWPEGIIPHPKEAKPKDMTWGYVDTDIGAVHVMAGYYIVTDSLGKRHVYERESFEDAFRPVIVIGDHVSPIPQGGDATIPVAEKQKHTTKIKTFESRRSVDDLDRQVNTWLAENKTEIINVAPFAREIRLNGTYSYDTVFMVTVTYKED